MNVAIEDLAAVNFTLIRHNGKHSLPLPKVTGSRQSLVVFMPIPENVYSMFPPSNGQSPCNRDQVTFKVTPGTEPTITTYTTSTIFLYLFFNLFFQIFIQTLNFSIF
jgi:hypothetical protein